MNYRIKLTKKKQEDLQLFQDVLHHFSGTRQTLIEATGKKEYAIDMSIAIELWYEINKKTLARHPAKESNLKLSLHKAYIMLDALQEYAKEYYSDYEQSCCNRFYMEIDEQLPTNTQLAIART